MELKTSGKEQVFSTGAQRDSGVKPRVDLRSPFAAEREGTWMRLGAERYAARNWEKGMPFSRVLASLERHVMWYKQGDRTEDHLAAIVFNAEAIMHYEEMIRRKRLPASLDDLPDYAPDYSSLPTPPAVSDNTPVAADKKTPEDPAV